MKIFHPGNGQTDSLAFELAGVMNITALDADVLFDFFTCGHPGIPGCRYKPGLIQPIIKDRCFGVFLATEGANPQSERPLFTCDDLEQYRNRFGLVFCDEWNTWAEVYNLFKEATCLDN